MAKGNNGSRLSGQQKKRSSSYFKRQIDSNGPDFLSRMNPYQMSKDYIAIARDLCSGFFDPMKDGMYLTNPDLLEALINTSAQEGSYYESNMVAQNFYITQYSAMYGSYAVDPSIVISFNRNMRYMNIHKTINYYLYCIKMSGDYIGWTTVMLDSLDGLCKVSGPPPVHLIDPQQFYNKS